jgi:hypothetical protein
MSAIAEDPGVWKVCYSNELDRLDQGLYIASMLPGFLVIIPFLPMMAAIHDISSPERNIFGLLGIAFAGISVAMLGF